MLKIRLTQTGTTNRKMYRIIAIEEGKRRDGKALETLGSYNPLVKPPQIVLKKDHIAYWQSKGAQVTPAVEKFLKI